VGYGLGTNGANLALYDSYVVTEPYCEGDIIISQFPAFEAYYTYLVEVAQVYRTQ